MEKRFLLFLVLLPLVFSLVHAAPTIIQPESIDEPLSVGDEFTLNVEISGVIDLYIFEFKLSYDPKLLKAKDVETSFLNEPSLVVKKDIDDETGTVHVVATSYGPVDPKSGSGTLAKISFRVVGVGKGIFEITDVTLMTKEKEEIEFETRSAAFETKPGKVLGIESSSTLLVVILIVIIIGIFFFVPRKRLRRIKKRSRRTK